MTQPPDPNAGALFQAHSRLFEGNRYVYPVVSRRAGGISVGVNLNLDKICNFDCVYCQVNRTELGSREFVDTDRLVTELDSTLELITSGRIFETERFRQTPEPLRRLNDVAFSGDGEPTTYRNFDEVVAACAEIRRRRRLDDLKLVLITNASMFHRPRVRGALEILDANNGEIWAKLDAGTEAYYKLIIRSVIPLGRILSNLLEAARVRPIVIQSLFMRVNGQPPPLTEQEAYCERLKTILAEGGLIKLVQVHTIARPPAEGWVSAMSNAEVDAMVEFVRQETGLEVAGYYGR
jgi:wyosine [tRNA(Phe)-imidazoG37] synthetase (radical SAM superfamily)